MMEGQKLIQVLQIDHYTEISIFLGDRENVGEKSSFCSVYFFELIPIESTRFISLFIANFYVELMFI